MPPRYRVLDLPLNGLGAFTPIFRTNPTASSWGLVHVTGSPGVVPVPVSKPQDSWAPVPSTTPLMQPSNVVPSVILPSIYIAHVGDLHNEVIGPRTLEARRHTPLPIPAQNWIRRTGQAMTATRIGGRRAMRWPRAFQRFPTS